MMNDHDGKQSYHDRKEEEEEDDDDEDKKDNEVDEIIDSLSQEIISDYQRPYHHNTSISNQEEEFNDDKEDTHHLLLDHQHSKETQNAKRYSLWQIIAMCTWQIGLTMGWNAMFQTSTPLFKALGLSPLSVSFANLAGPLSGLIFQPICGVISDEATFQWGRRRPFILFGTIFGLIGMLLFAYPIQLTNLLSGSNQLSVAFAIMGLWIMNIGLNIVQGPAWALLFDLLPPEQQATGNAILQILGAAAGLLGSLLGAAPLTKMLPFIDSQSLALFWFAIIFLILSVIPPLVFIHETPFTPKEVSESSDEAGFREGYEEEEYRTLSSSSSLRSRSDRSCWQSVIASLKKAGRAVKKIFRQIFVVGLYEMTEEVFWILLVYFFVNCAGTPPMFYGTDYFGEVVYHGSPDPDSYLYSFYEKGVRMGALGFAVSGLVQICTSAILPYLTNLFGFKPVWIITQAATTLVLLLLILSFFQSLVVSMVFVAILGIGTSAAGVIPFAMVGMIESTKEKAGLTIALLNSAQVIAQTVAIFSSGLIVSLTNDVASGIAIGGGYGLVSLFVTIFYLKAYDRSKIRVTGL